MKVTRLPVYVTFAHLAWPCVHVPTIKTRDLLTHISQYIRWRSPEFTISQKQETFWHIFRNIQSERSPEFTISQKQETLSLYFAIYTLEVPRICNIIKTRDLLSYISQYMHREVPRIHDTIKTRDPFRYISQYIRRRSLEFTINTGNPTDGVSWRWDILQIQHMHTWTCTYTKTRDPMIDIFRNIPTTRPLAIAISRKQEASPQKEKVPRIHNITKKRGLLPWHIRHIPTWGPSQLQHRENKKPPLEREGPSNSQYIGTYPHDMHHISKIPYTTKTRGLSSKKKRSLEFTTSQKREVSCHGIFVIYPHEAPRNCNIVKTRNLPSKEKVPRIRNI